MGDKGRGTAACLEQHSTVRVYTRAYTCCRQLLHTRLQLPSSGLCVCMCVSQPPSPDPGTFLAQTHAVLGVHKGAVMAGQSAWLQDQAVVSTLTARTGPFWWALWGRPWPSARPWHAPTYPPAGRSAASDVSSQCRRSGILCRTSPRARQFYTRGHPFPVTHN